MSALAPQRLLVLGGSSEIAAAMLASLPADTTREVVLAGRDPAALERAAARVRSEGRGAARTLVLDATDTAAHGPVLSEAFDAAGGFDLAILAVGQLGERGGLPEDIEAAVELLRVNTVGAGSLLMHTAALMRERRGGTIAVLSSVAAERARASNAVYCASKAGLDALAQGLGDALAGDGVRVLVIRPGFVKTRMTAGLPAPPLATTPDVVAAQALAGLRRGSHTVWAPSRLRWVMAVLRMLPRPLFRRIPA
ncbi:MAG TPA: SDR family NAD(P)-dependent oxidoreductase [Solirubrobacteraceae bacterium]